MQVRRMLLVFSSDDNQALVSNSQRERVFSGDIQQGSYILEYPEQDQSDINVDTVLLIIAKKSVKYFSPYFMNPASRVTQEHHPQVACWNSAYGYGSQPSDLQSSVSAVC